MREKIELTQAETNDILRMLEENIPIKFMPIISAIGRFFNSKFEDVTGEQVANTEEKSDDSNTNSDSSETVTV